MSFLRKLFHAIVYLPGLIVGIEPLFGPKRGEDKKATVTGAVAAILGFAEAVSARDIVDQDRFNEGLSQVIDGTVKMLNASIWQKKTV